MEAKKKAQMLTVVGAVLGASLGTFAVNALMHKDPKDLFDKVLVETSTEINKTLPRQLDKETRMDATSAGPGNRFTYVYSMINYRKDDVNPDLLKKALSPGIINNYKTQPDMSRFRENNVELHYQYKDKEGVFITEIVVSPKDFAQ